MIENVLPYELRAPRSKIPSRDAIKKWWAEHESAFVLNKFDSIEEFVEEEYCWACGFTSDYTLERCHVIPVLTGGTNEFSNLVLMCSTCHRASEYIDDIETLKNWMIARTFFDRQMEVVCNGVGGYTSFRMKQLAA